MPQIDLKIGCAEDRELLILHVHGGEDSPCYYIGDSVFEIFVRTLATYRLWLIVQDISVWY